jgi:uncharacterized protein (TIGR02996 family)
MASVLDEALALYARTRNSALTPVIIALGERALADFAPPTHRKNIDFHREWLKRVGDSPARSWALKTLMTQLPKLLDGQEHVAGERIDAVTERVEALESVAPDPRIVHTLLALLDLSPPNFNGWDPVVARLFARHGDETTQAALREAAPYFWNKEHYGDDLDISTLKFAQAAPLSAAEQAKFPAPKGLTQPNAERLWQAVYDAPDDDAPREVLSDFLQEQGDPRGEFIALQLREHRGEATDADLARAQALTKEHGKAWLGPLRPIVARAEMRRGFLWRLELAGSWSAKPKVWDALASHPSLATVEELWRGKAVTKLVVPFLKSGALRSLRLVTVEDKLMVQAVAGSVLPKLEGLIDADTPAAIAYATENQRIISLVFPRRSVATDAKKWPEALRERLVRISCADDPPKAAALWSTLPRLRELRCGFEGCMALTRTEPHLMRVIDESHCEYKGVPRAVKLIETNVSEASRARLSKLHPRFTFVARPRPSGLITNPKG